MWSMLATICILAAAFIISSKYGIRPKGRIYAFSFYLGACVAFIGLGIMINDWWLIGQQVILTGFNTRGIYIAIKEIRK